MKKLLTAISIEGNHMMKKRYAIVLGTMMAVGVANLAQAGNKNAPDVLAEVTAGGCETVQIAPFGTSLLANWSWDNTNSVTGQSKFGGDAVYTVELIDDGTGNPIDVEVEFEVTQYELGTAAEDYPGQLVYRCSNAQTEVSGDCNGAVLGLRSALQTAVEDAGYVWDSNVIKATLDEVGVKAMKGTGRQNYSKVDVCSVI